MKTFCRIFVCLLAFVNLTFVFSCTPIQTDDEFVIKLEGDKIKWSNYKDAVKYCVFIDTIKSDTVTTNFYVISDKTTTHEYRIQAVFADETYEYSNSVTYYGSTTSFNVSVSNNELNWSFVNGAITYKIYVDNSLYEETLNTSLTLSLDYGKYLIRVDAIDSTNNIIKSREFEYENKEKTKNVVNIFEINDTHGAILDDANNQSIAKVASIINEIELNDYLIKIACGDIFQGTFVSNETKGRIFIDVLNELSFDAFVIGNHEFDWGIEEVAKYKDGDLTNGEADFKFLGANIVNKETKQRLDFLDDYIIKEVNGIKVGIIGVIGGGLEDSIFYDNIAPYEFLEPVEVCKPIIRKLRKEEKCDLVVVANHEYLEYTNVSFASLSGDYKVDGLICGHTHQTVEEYVEGKNGNKIPCIQSSTKNYTAGLLKFNFDDEKNITSSSLYHYKPSEYKKDQRILEVISKYDDIIARSSEVIATTDHYISKEELGYLATTCLKETFSSDIGIINRGGVRAPIETNSILSQDVYNAYPFSNNVYIIHLTGDKVKELYDNDGDYLYFNYDFNKASLSSSKSYKIAIIDYVFTSPRYSYVFEDVEFVDTGTLIRDSVTDYLMKLKHITADSYKKVSSNIDINYYSYIQYYLGDEHEYI